MRTMMPMEEVREIARLIGIASAEKFQQKEDLIKTIQLAMGFEDCYHVNSPEQCGKSARCMWAGECRQSETEN